jgi:hypothetical protein
MVKIDLLVSAHGYLPPLPYAHYGGIGVSGLIGGKDIWIVWV